MTIQYTNRIGKTYYLRQGTTKTGKTRYFFSGQKDGIAQAVDSFPDGYEIYEHPANTQVFLRKKRPQLITDREKQLVTKQTDALKRSKGYRVDCLDEYITIYESNIDKVHLNNLLKNFLQQSATPSGVDTDDAITTVVNVADRDYTAILRFRLVEPNLRRFSVERFCFRGSIDDWIYLDGLDKLDNLAKKWINMLGTDKFWESPYF
ncbi:MAG: hypothetical protein QNJ37_25005 [Crocosphaera sp.]|nr:hypothetical protein [Crocosphaera sp.]